MRAALVQPLTCSDRRTTFCAQLHAREDRVNRPISQWPMEARAVSGIPGHRATHLCFHLTRLLRGLRFGPLVQPQARPIRPVQAHPADPCAAGAEAPLPATARRADIHGAE